MKKIFISFLSVLTIYHFLFSSFVSVYAFEENEMPVFEECCDVPVVYDRAEFYSASAALGSVVLGGVGVTVAPATIAGVALGAVTIGLGSYVVYKGLGNIANISKEYYENYISKIDLSNLMNISFDMNGNLVFETIKDVAKSVAGVFVTNSYKQNYTVSETENISSSIYGSNSFFLVNDLTNITIESFKVSNFVNGSARFGVFYLSAPTGLSFQVQYSTTSGVGTLYTPRLSIYHIGSTAYVKALDVSSYGLYNYRMSMDGSMTRLQGNTSGYTPVFSNALNTLQWKENGKDGSNVRYDLNLSTILSTVGVSLVNADLLYHEHEEIFENIVTHDYVISNEYIGTLNPDITFEDGSWVNSDGEEVEPFDVTVPLGNVMNPDGSIGFDSTLDSVLGGTTSNPPVDTTPPDDVLPDINFDSIIGFLSSILNWLVAFPGWLISNLVNVIVSSIQAIPTALSGVLGSISTGINNTWEWCKGLPNVLGELLGALGSAIVDGLTLAFSGVISGIQTIVDFFVGILDFIMSLVIPSDGFFSSELSKLGDVFNSKFPFFSQIGDILNAFKFDINAPLPEFKITVPIKFGGGTYNVINFAHFVSYRQYILNFIRLFTWIPFLMRIYKKSMYMATGK